jgi:hypothetical protein
MTSRSTPAARPSSTARQPSSTRGCALPSPSTLSATARRIIATLRSLSPQTTPIRSAATGPSPLCECDNLNLHPYWYFDSSVGVLANTVRMAITYTQQSYREFDAAGPQWRVAQSSRRVADGHNRRAHLRQHGLQVVGVHRHADRMEGWRVPVILPAPSEHSWQWTRPTGVAAADTLMATLTTMMRATI